MSDVRFVSMEHVEVWLLDMEDNHKTDDIRHLVKCRPWTSQCQQDFNTIMYEKMQNAVLQYIMDYPGVTLVSVK